MLVKSLTTSPESWGHYTLFPGQWGFLPDGLQLGSPAYVAQNFKLLPTGEPEGKADIVIFSGCSLGTTGGGQHPAQIARALAALGHRILFVQSNEFSGEAGPEIIVLQEPGLFRTNYPSSIDSEKWESILNEFSNKSNRIVLFTFPSAFLAGLAYIAKSLDYQTAYWCLDDWAEINKAQGQSAYKPEIEIELTQTVDKVFATAGSLAAHLSEYRHDIIEIIPNGFSPVNFPEPDVKPGIPADMVIGEKTIVYWGELQGRWIDWGLIEGLAKAKPNWSFNLIGPNQWLERDLKLPNVHLLGEKDVSCLYQYGWNADFGLIPFKVNQLTAAVNPIKAYEYLACQLPVLSTPMPELDAFPMVYQSPADPWQFVFQVEQHEPEVDKDLQDFLSQSTWTGRAEAFINACERS